MDEIQESPFQPGHPVSPNKFKGREEAFKKILRYLPKTKNSGELSNFYVTGKKGMGKTSFINYVACECDKLLHMTPVYVNADGVDSLDELIDNLIDSIIKKAKMLSWGNKLLDIFFRYVDELKINGTGLKFKCNPVLVNGVKHDFASFILEISEKLKEENKGLFIFIDDMNGLSKTLEFSSWYKRFIDTISFENTFTPVAFCLVSYPDEFDNLAFTNPSFSRIFERIIIDNIHDDE